ncbi:MULTISPECIES: hypothetical protein [unclassified Sphingopyxis]|uniref:hypothetical protein n=1 Tax=unclassified Sphingopyxis TaxID=2614943 RepID=UPI00073172FC|nr:MULTISPECIES: hypothetical protein [unclassified Sphingopyxis]KTE13298.1 hypothetical protein ATE70_01070 [Sphingopyxis sp. H053]KTE31138.1 hypothetical protein ATE75_01045 [Sphingopyxis sp. H080]KTE46969.1 hypothetical protein ATE77_01070 [Sphingopyxis sp. H005]KTE71390.1 hypothetical protein ATE74_01070 [Sphingopyxis sp. H085]
MTISGFNNRAHEIISGVLDRAEDWIARNGVCPAHQADAHLTTKYIEACANIIRGGVVYLAADERIGADIFLSGLGDAKFKRLSPRTQTMCAEHLSHHTHVYFPNYHTVLRLAYLHVLRSACGQVPFHSHGVVLLAASTLPGVLSDVRRECRRRGLNYDRVLVPETEKHKKSMSLKVIANK